MTTTNPYGPSSAAAEVIAGVDLTGRRAIVTGGNSGIGLETARALASAGALAAAGDARVVVVSSRGHLQGEVLFDDVNFEHHPYDRWAAYSQSKTANVLFAVEAARRWAAAGITVNALTPGRIRTNLMRHIGDETTANAPTSFGAVDPSITWKTTEQGAATSVLLAASPLVRGVTGTYFEDCRPAALAVPGGFDGVAAYAIDPANADRLWKLSESLLS
jgi:NAD(P)-dependent dehydrogenase (short-subunit alcohol dehydrogenase family)